MGRWGYLPSSSIRKIFTVRRVLLALLSLPVGLVVLLWTSGYWLPWVAPAATNWAGVEIGGAERVGPGRIELSEVSYAATGFTLSVDQVELPTPIAYLRERWRGEGFSERSRVRLSEVDLVLADAETTKHGEADAATSKILDQVNDGVKAADPWLPGVRMDRLTLSGSGLPETFVFEDIRLENGAFAIAMAKSELSPRLTVDGSIAPDSPWSIAVELPEHELQADVRLEAAEAPDAGWIASGEFRRASDRVKLRAEWGPAGLPPESAGVDATDFTVPADWLRALAADYAYGPLRIERLALDWKDGRYSGDLILSGEAAIESQETVPLRADLSLSGDLESLQIREARIDTPWLESRLDGPLAYRFDDGTVDRSARFDLRLDLSAQPFIEASGIVQGSVQLAPSAETGFELAFDLSGTDLAYDAYTVPKAEVEGSYAGGVLRLTDAALFPPNAEGEALRASGRIDLATQEMDLEASLATDDSGWLNALAGQSILDGPQSVEATVRGNFAQPKVEGTLRIGAKVEGLSRLRLEGDVAAALTTSPFTVPAFSFDGSANVEQSGIETALSGRWSADALELAIEKLVSMDRERPRLALAEPVALRLNFDEPDAPIEQRLHVGPFQLTGPGIDLSGAWESGEPLRLRIANLSSKRVDRWLTNPLPEILVESAELEVVALRPLLEGRLSLEAVQTDPDLGRLRVSGQSRFNADGVVADSLELSLNGEPLFSGSGRAPVRLAPFAEADARVVRFDPNGALAGGFSGRSTAPFSDWLKRTTGAVLSDARFELELDGSPTAPRGNLSLTAEALEMPQGLSESSLPPLQKIRLEATADAEQLQVGTLDFSVNDSPVSGNAELPTDALVALLEEFDPDVLRNLAEAARAELSLEGWELADWTGRVPAALRRSGRLSGFLRLAPGLDLSGELTFSDFGLRPTASLPPVDNIGGRLRLEERVLYFEEAGAQVGGNPIAFTGQLDASDLTAPTWTFQAQGENLPIVRTTDMIVRSDVDVSASQSDDGQPPLVQGELNLRSSTLLIEFDPLSPSVRSGPRQTPPFFSITEDPFAEWRFDLKIRGDDFLRVRSPYLRGLLSADFDLTGSFAQPKLIGAVRMGESEIRFPGAKVKVDSGEAYIAEGQSDVVQLDITGVAKTSSYVISMDVSNTLTDPHIEFQSTPELSNAEIVRLLATGSTRSGGAGTVGLYLGQGLLGGPGMDEGLMDRLTIDIGENVTRKGKETIGVEYDLAEDYYLHGEYDQFDAYNLDLVWSLFRK